MPGSSSPPGHAESYLFRLKRFADKFFRPSINFCVQHFGKVGISSVFGLFIVGVIFFWVWQTKEWQPTIAAIATGLGALLGASAGLLRAEETARWVLAIAGGIFTAWVAGYTNSDLTAQIREKTELADALSKRLDAAKGNLVRYVALLPREKVSPILREAGIRARDRFNDAIKSPPPFRRQDFALTLDILDFMSSIDADNGHVHYLSGDIARKLRDPGKGRADFYAYLNKEERDYPKTREGDLGFEPCKTAEGFCRERTAWIFHLLANDFYEDAVQKKNARRPMAEYYPSLSTAFEHACSAIKLFRQKGFNDPNQGTPTSEIQKAVAAELGRTCQ